MNKIICSLLLASVLAIAGCSSPAREKLAAEIKEADRMCPYDLGTSIAESIRYDKSDNCVVMTFAIDEDFIKLDNLANAGQAQKTYLSAFLQGEDGSDMLGLLVDADAALRVVFRSSQSGDSIMTEFSDEELAQVRDSDDGADNSYEQLSGMIAISQAQCPLAVSEYITLADISLERERITFRFEYDSDQSELEADTAVLKETISEGLKEDFSSSVGQQQYKHMAKYGIGIRHIYTDTRGNKAPCVVDFPFSELPLCE